MTPKKKINPDTKCAQCGHVQHLHVLVNYADPFVGQSVLVCPTSLYAAPASDTDEIVVCTCQVVTGGAVALTPGCPIHDARRTP
jgi:hypothetical protein